MRDECTLMSKSSLNGLSGGRGISPAVFVNSFCMAGIYLTVYEAKQQEG